MKPVKAAALAFALAAIAGGCGSTKPATQFTVGVLSQISVPRDLQSIRIAASSGGQVGFCNTYPVVDGKARLPKSLALAPGGDPNRIVTVVVTGYTTDNDTLDQYRPDKCDIPLVSPSDAFDPQNPSTPPPDARILRRSRQSYIDSQNLYLPMPLRYSCYGVNCADLQTCKGGQCVDSATDPKTLPAFDPELLVGETLSCFDVGQCLGDAVGPNVIDAATCTYEVPPGTSLLSQGMNVRVIYGGYRTEVLDLDKDEGFFLPDASGHPNRFQLAKGLCNGTDPKLPKIVSVVASTTCPSKNVYQPLCVSDTKVTALPPSPSALYLLMDQDSSMVDYVGTANAMSMSTDKTGGLDAVLALALGDPVFATTELAFRFVPDAGMTACTASSYAQPALIPGFSTKFVPVGDAAKPVANLVGSTLPALATGVLGENVFLTAMGAYGAPLPTTDSAGRTIGYNRKAIVLATNRSLDPTDKTLGCMGDAIAGATAAKAAGFDTYLFSLRDAANPSTAAARIAAVDHYAAVAHVIHAEGGATGADEMGSQLAALSGISSLVSDLGACLYDAPDDFTDPATAVVTVKAAEPGPAGALPYDPTCSATSTTANGWSLEPKPSPSSTTPPHVRVCGGACAVIRGAIADSLAFTASRSAMGAVLPSQVLVSLARK